MMLGVSGIPRISKKGGVHTLRKIFKGGGGPPNFAAEHMGERKNVLKTNGKVIATLEDVSFAAVSVIKCHKIGKVIRYY